MYQLRLKFWLNWKVDFLKEQEVPFQTCRLSPMVNIGWKSTYLLAVIIDWILNLLEHTKIWLNMCFYYQNWFISHFIENQRPISSVG